ncbi:MAG: HEAT repeat domain-containing protein [Candidatus Melainabacteria bacterium]|nr:HEAT repeat domain-containing protein [Candidatus Melainabacteria bacterium]
MVSLLNGVHELVQRNNTLSPLLNEEFKKGRKPSGIYFKKDDKASSGGASGSLDETVKGLINDLKNKNSNIRINTLQVLVRLGEEANAAVPVLIKKLKSEKDLSVRNYVVYTIGSMGEKAVPRLIKVLKDEDPGIRKGAAQALERIGEKASAAVPALIETLKDEDKDVRAYTASALTKIGEAAVPALINILNDENLDIQRCAVNILGGIGEKAVPGLMKSFENGTSNVQTQSDALWTLQHIGEKAVPVLMKIALNHQNPTIREGAADAIGKIGEKNNYHRVMVELIKALGKK